MKKYMLTVGLGSTVSLIFVVAFLNLQPSEPLEIASNQKAIQEKIFVPPKQLPKPSGDFSLNDIDSISSDSLVEQKSRSNNAALHELEELVVREKERYEQIFDEYKSAIKIFETLSSEFDEMIYDKVPSNELAVLDNEMQQQATRIIELQRESNQAYSILMAKYDEVMPSILTKHF